MIQKTFHTGQYGHEAVTWNIGLYSHFWGRVKLAPVAKSLATTCMEVCRGSVLNTKPSKCMSNAPTDCTITAWMYKDFKLHFSAKTWWRVMKSFTICWMIIQHFNITHVHYWWEQSDFRWFHQRCLITLP